MKNKSIPFFILSIFLVLSDQATKLAVKGFSLFGISHQGMNYGEQIRVIGEFLQFTFIENEGMAFGISFGPFKIILSLFSIIAAIALAYYLYKLSDYHFWVKLGIALILAGAAGNLVDRVFYGVFYGYESLFYGRVVDFIQVDIPDINLPGFSYSHWPVFNIADSCVSCGVVLLLVFHKRIPAMKELFGRKNSSETELIEDKS